MSDRIVTVNNFLEAGKEILTLDIATGGDHLNKAIHEGAINRPGLALAGFMQYFANRRIQVMGLSEFAYLKSLTPKKQEARLHEICSKNIPCIVLTRNRHPLDAIITAAQKKNIPVLRTPMITSQFINAATQVMEKLLAPELRMQGTMLDIHGLGVLIEGHPGIGKSEMALELIERGHSLVADDVTLFKKIGAQDVTGMPIGLTRAHMEIRGLGIIHIPSLFGVTSTRPEMRLNLIIQLHPWTPEDDDDRTGMDRKTREIMGVEIPVITLPVTPGKNMAHIIELAARNQKLKMLGHDTAKELDDRLVEMLLEKSNEVRVNGK